MKKKEKISHKNIRKLFLEGDPDAIATIRDINDYFYEEAKRMEEDHERYEAYRQELFNCLSDLGCTPTSSEMDEVERIVEKGLNYL